MLSEFRAFLLKTNALALAIGVIIGTAMGAVVGSLVNDVIMPPIGYALGGVDFSSLQVVIGQHTDSGGRVTDVAIRYGAFINTIIAFVVIAFVVFMIARTFIREPEPAPKPEMRDCPFCRESILASASRCPHCTSQLTDSRSVTPVAG